MKNSEEKIIRDLVHDYFNLTTFELMIIDTVAFQRLKDIRQLTCQHVYPNARHTRFEHSLGVLELTKRAIRYINKNGFIDQKIKGDIIGTKNKVNTQIAALLHDVGHCPFSHMGEVEMDENEVKSIFIKEIKKCQNGNNKIITNELFEIISENTYQSAIHEKLSCIAILKHYYGILMELNKYYGEDVDFDLIFRCILGIPYKINSNTDQIKGFREKNLCISLINDRIFDMDKLDYIMRDSLYTGIGTPRIDTKRLFRNLKVSSDYRIVFLSKAVPALQSIIESRDSLYMWVYNHHSVIYSDFIYGYIFRRFSRNAEKHPEVKKIKAGIVPKKIIFSVESVLTDFCSDSNVQYILNEQLRLKNKRKVGNIYKESEEIERALTLVENLQKRQFLKPWWKTVFEFNTFMTRNFSDDSILTKICKYVSHKGEYGLNPEEFRSQIAKHVIYLTEKMYESGKMLKKLRDGEFFIVQRSNRFFELDTIEKFVIYLKKNEIIDAPNDVVDITDGYFGKYLTNLLPQKKYSTMYKSDGFYIYVQKYENNSCAVHDEPSEMNNSYIKKRYYNMIERAFAFVATNLVKMDEIDFINTFGISSSDEDEKKSKEKMWNKFEEEVFNS